MKTAKATTNKTQGAFATLNEEDPKRLRSFRIPDRLIAEVGVARVDNHGAYKLGLRFGAGAADLSGRVYPCLDEKGEIFNARLRRHRKARALFRCSGSSRVVLTNASITLDTQTFNSSGQPGEEAETYMREIINHKDIDDLITQLRDRSDLSLAEVACRMMWSVALLSQLETGDRSLPADRLGELADKIEAPEALYLRTLFEREWRLTGWSRARHRETSFQFESNCRYALRLSVRIKLNTDQTAPLNE